MKQQEAIKTEAINTEAINTEKIKWHCLAFSELTTDQLYELLQLRVDVFVVEQECPYPELDGHDRHPGTHHLLGYQESKLVACMRLLPVGLTSSNVSLGRVATHQDARGNGLGHRLLEEGLEQAEKLWSGETIKIGAQSYLNEFYQGYGFEVISDEYLEDGIPHIDMLLHKNNNIS